MVRLFVMYGERRRERRGSWRIQKEHTQQASIRRHLRRVAGGDIIRGGGVFGIIMAARSMFDASMAAYRRGGGKIDENIIDCIIIYIAKLSETGVSIAVWRGA